METVNEGQVKYAMLLYDKLALLLPKRNIDSEFYDFFHFSMTRNVFNEKKNHKMHFQFPLSPCYQWHWHRFISSTAMITYMHLLK